MLQRLTGLRSYQTDYGIMVEVPDQYDLEKTVAEVNRMFNPPPVRDPRCTCGAVLISPGCPVHPMT